MIKFVRLSSNLCCLLGHVGHFFGIFASGHGADDGAKNGLEWLQCFDRIVRLKQMY